MRILIISLVFIFLQALAFPVSSQQFRLQIKNQTLREVLREVEKQGKYSFIYNEAFEDLNKYISVSYEGVDVGDLMAIVLNDTKLSYQLIDDELIVITPRREAQGLQQNGDADIVIRGQVMSADDNMTLPGATVSIRGTSVGTTTDVDGRYELSVPDESAVLVFAFMGMETREERVGDRRVINVALSMQLYSLEEMVVTGYAVQQRRDISSAISSVRTESIEGMPADNLSRAIQGRASGVQITTSGGIAGGHSSTIIRGFGSFASNTPLYIVDGVQIHTERLSSRSASHNALAGLDFNDIESIDILKDASAAAIYGARGANGVIIITTKRGQAAERTKFDFRLSTGFSETIKRNDVLDGPQWVKWYLDAYRNRYGEDHPAYYASRDLMITRGWLAVESDGSFDIIAPTYDWQDAVYRRGATTEARLSASGGNDRTRFYISGSYNTTDGHVISYDFKRASFRANLDHKVNDRLSIDNSSTVSFYRQNTTRADGAYTNPVRAAWQIIPMNPIYDEYGEFEDQYGNYYGVPRGLFGSNYANILHDNELNYTIANNIKYIHNLAINYNITKNLTFRSAWGVDYNDNDDEQWYDPRTHDGQSPNGALRDYNTTIVIWQGTNTLNFSETIQDRHRVQALLGAEASERIWKNTETRGEGFANPNINHLGAASTVPGWYGNVTVRRTAGFFSRFNYTLDDKYILTLTGRYDGSSRFGEDNRWGFFPSTALAWRLSSEKFMERFSNLDNLMIRLGYGISGSDAADTYAALGLWGAGAQYMGQPAIFPSQLPNRLLTWEESATANLGVNIAAYQGRINAEFDVFRRLSRNLLLNMPIPANTGWTSVNSNVGKVQNQGFEMGLYTINIDMGRRFRWNTDFNFTYSRNEILELLPGTDYFNTRTMVGQPIDSRLVHKWAGVNVADGRPMYYDKNMNITYNPTLEDRHWTNRSHQPTHYGGLTNTLRFGDIQFSFMFQYSLGNERYLSEKRYGFSRSSLDVNVYEYNEERWREPGDVTFVPQIVYGDAYAGDVRSPSLYASHMVERVDYVRLKDISLTYDLPKILIERGGIDRFQVYIRATNLWTLHNYSGLDPEFTGDDFGNYPQGKTITLGLRTNF
jgi:TonB-dependent starch-binding outer membrane protein SusC